MDQHRLTDEEIFLMVVSEYKRRKAPRANGKPAHATITLKEYGINPPPQSNGKNVPMPNEEKQYDPGDPEIQEFIVNEDIRRLLEPPQTEDARKMIGLNDYQLNIIPENAAIGRVRKPVFFELFRIINGRIVPAGPAISEAAFYMFGTNEGRGEPYFIESTRLRRLLYDNRNTRDRIVVPCPGGRSVMAVIDRKILLDHCCR